MKPDLNKIWMCSLSDGAAVNIVETDPEFPKPHMRMCITLCKINAAVLRSDKPT